MFIKVKVHPDSSTERVLQKSDDAFEIYIKEEARHGVANKSMITLLARFLRVAPSRLHIQKGGRSRGKIIKIRELSGGPR